MINHKKKIIFIHIPKTGGQSIAKALGIAHPPSAKFAGLKHGTPNFAEHSKHWDKYFKFTWVRNPWDRLVSNYFYDLKMSEAGINVKGLRALVKKFGKNKFKDFVKSGKFKSLGFYAPLFTWMPKGKQYDFIGKFENFEKDFEKLCGILQFKDIGLPHVNETRHTHYSEYYDDEAKEIAGDYYAKDTKYFGYKFGE
tara:strand:- start:133 stop:720 length:588 start_codon:yes stop_codon:yes gene_type:complete